MYKQQGLELGKRLSNWPWRILCSCFVCSLVVPISIGPYMIVWCFCSFRRCLCSSVCVSGFLLVVCLGRTADEVCGFRRFCLR